MTISDLDKLVELLQEFQKIYLLGTVRGFCITETKSIDILVEDIGAIQFIAMKTSVEKERKI